MRPFFKNIRTLSGIQVTRNHPPIEGVDDGDHASMHPGIWMAFGDISGSDFWRNRARVVHERFITRPSGGKSFGSFSVSNRFETTDGKLICRQVDTHTIRLAKGGWRLTYDCEFTGPDDFYFGDQEEMGLGVRLATPLIEKKVAKSATAPGRSARSQRGDNRRFGAITPVKPRANGLVSPSWPTARPRVYRGGITELRPYGGQSISAEKP